MLMPFNDTTAKTGIIQKVEFYTGLGDAAISGDSTKLKIVTGLVNDAFDELMPYLVSFSNFLKWDDSTGTDMPFGTFNLVSGQSDYTISVDDNSLDILNIVNVQVLPSATDTVYSDIEEATLDDESVLDFLQPTSSGVPTAWLKRGNTIHFNLLPNYNATAGVKIYFERQQNYFVSTDTTKEAGIPRPFHALLPLYAAYYWLSVNKQADTTLITRVEAAISRKLIALDQAIKGRFPHRTKLTMKKINYR